MLDYIDRFEDEKNNYQSVIEIDIIAIPLQFTTFDLFMLYHPKEASKLMGWVRPLKPIIPIPQMEKFILARTKGEILKCFGVETI